MSTTGPAIATTRPSFSFVSLSVMVMTAGSYEGGSGVRARCGRGVRDLVGLQGLGAADDLHDLGGDRVLAGAVHDAREADDEVFGVVGRGLHGALASRLLGRGRVEQRRVDAGLDVARQEAVEDRVGRRLELVRGLRALVALGARRLRVAAFDHGAIERDERADQHLLHAGADEAGVDDLDPVERALGVLLHDGRGDRLGVGVRRPLGEAR